MAQKPFNKSDLDESVRGVILDEELTDLVGSYFNLPIVISGKLAGIIKQIKKDVVVELISTTTLTQASITSDIAGRILE